MCMHNVMCTKQMKSIAFWSFLHVVLPLPPSYFLCVNFSLPACDCMPVHLQTGSSSFSYAGKCSELIQKAATVSHSFCSYLFICALVSYACVPAADTLMVFDCVRVQKVSTFGCLLSRFIHLMKMSLMEDHQPLHI